MDGLIMIYFGMYALGFGEIAILAWFLRRRADLNQGITDFNVSKKIPIFYILFSLTAAITIISIDRNLMTGAVISLAKRQDNAMGMFVLMNLTTPLFWILDDMKHRKIEEIAESNQDKT